MAQLRKKHLFTFDRAAWGGEPFTRVKVGHNREIQLDHDTTVNQPQLRCFLHGSEVATFTRRQGGGLEVCLDPCGYLTVTTQAAMKDFMRAMGVSAGVSFAKGRFGVRILTDGGEYADFDDISGAFLHDLADWREAS